MSLSTTRDGTARPVLARLADLLGGTGEHGLAQRRAMTAFAIRVASAALAINGFPPKVEPWLPGPRAAA